MGRWQQGTWKLRREGTTALRSEKVAEGTAGLDRSGGLTWDERLSWP